MFGHNVVVPACSQVALLPWSSVKWHNLALALGTRFLGLACAPPQMKMWKRGNRLRLDCSLGPFRGLKWRRGRLSFMFFGDSPDPKSQLVIVDHINQRFTRVWPENTPEKSLGRYVRPLHRCVLVWLPNEGCSCALGVECLQSLGQHDGLVLAKGMQAPVVAAGGNRRARCVALRVLQQWYFFLSWFRYLCTR